MAPVQGALPTLQEGVAVQAGPAATATWEFTKPTAWLIDVQPAEDYAGNPYLLFVYMVLPGTLDALSPVVTRAGPEVHTRTMCIAVSYFGYRHYDPRTKQWLSRDPIGEAGGLNLFAYANNDPINGIDILGLVEAAIHAADMSIPGRLKRWAGGIMFRMEGRRRDVYAAHERGEINGVEVFLHRNLQEYAINPVPGILSAGANKTAGYIEEPSEIFKDPAMLNTLRDGATQFLKHTFSNIHRGITQPSTENTTEALLSVENVALILVSGKNALAKPRPQSSVPNGAQVASSTRQVVQPTNTLINPRLTQRLEAFRSYRMNGGGLDMRGWLKATQRQYGGVSGGYQSGFASWSRSLESVHGNSMFSNATAYLYRLDDSSGNLLKWGISQNPESRYASSFMLDKQMTILDSGPRFNILRIERNLVETQPGPLNFEPWRGMKLLEPVE